MKIIKGAGVRSLSFGDSRTRGGGAKASGEHVLSPPLVPKTPKRAYSQATEFAL